MKVAIELNPKDYIALFCGGGPGSPRYDFSSRRKVWDSRDMFFWAGGAHSGPQEAGNITKTQGFIRV